jgi:hypothetical protein
VYVPLRQRYWCSKIRNVTADIQVNISGQSLWDLLGARWYWGIILEANSLYPAISPPQSFNSPTVEAVWADIAQTV